MLLQKRHLELSNSNRGKVRAFFRFSAKRKNLEIFQMSQKKRLEILRCLEMLKVFSKKRNISFQKTRSNRQPFLNLIRPGTLSADTAASLFFVMTILSRSMACQR